MALDAKEMITPARDFSTPSSPQAETGAKSRTIKGCYSFARAGMVPAWRKIGLIKSGLEAESEREDCAVLRRIHKTAGNPEKARVCGK
jgi:hypothetical protein